MYKIEWKFDLNSSELVLKTTGERQEGRNSIILVQIVSHDNNKILFNETFQQNQTLTRILNDTNLKCAKIVLKVNTFDQNQINSKNSFFSSNLVSSTSNQLDLCPTQCLENKKILLNIINKVGSFLDSMFSKNTNQMNDFFFMLKKKSAKRGVLFDAGLPSFSDIGTFLTTNVNELKDKSMQSVDWLREKLENAESNIKQKFKEAKDESQQKILEIILKNSNLTNVIDNYLNITNNVAEKKPNSEWLNDILVVNEEEIRKTLNEHGTFNKNDLLKMDIFVNNERQKNLRKKRSTSGNLLGIILRPKILDQGSNVTSTELSVTSSIESLNLTTNAVSTKTTSIHSISTQIVESATTKTFSTDTSTVAVSTTEEITSNLPSTTISTTTPTPSTTTTVSFVLVEASSIIISSTTITSTLSTTTTISEVLATTTDSTTSTSTTRSTRLSLTFPTTLTDSTIDNFVESSKLVLQESVVVAFNDSSADNVTLNSNVKERLFSSNDQQNLTDEFRIKTVTTSLPINVSLTPQLTTTIIQVITPSTFTPSTISTLMTTTSNTTLATSLNLTSTTTTEVITTTSTTTVTSVTTTTSSTTTTLATSTIPFSTTTSTPSTLRITTKIMKQKPTIKTTTTTTTLSTIGFEELTTIGDMSEGFNSRFNNKYKTQNIQFTMTTKQTTISEQEFIIETSNTTMSSNIEGDIQATTQSTTTSTQATTFLSEFFVKTTQATTTTSLRVHQEEVDISGAPSDDSFSTLLQTPEPFTELNNDRDGMDTTEFSDDMFTDDLSDDLDDILELTTTTTTTTTPSTTTTTLDKNVKLEIMNYTILNNSTDSASAHKSDARTYSLRLHIKGFKWNEKFKDPNSIEAQEFLRTKIMPLLFKNLNLKKEDLNEIKLIRLFKGLIASQNSNNNKNSSDDNDDDHDD